MSASRKITIIALSLSLPVLITVVLLPGHGVDQVTHLQHLYEHLWNQLSDYLMSRR